MSEREYNRSPTRTVAEGAEAARQAGQDVAELVHGKQLAYGDASGLMHGFWHLALQQYLAPSMVHWYDHVDEGGATGRNNPGGHYVVPVELVDHMPRLTRVMDRVFRIIGNPAGDRMGENPWRDLAGDAVCGIVMPRTEAAPEPAGNEHRGALVRDVQGNEAWAFDLTEALRVYDEGMRVLANRQGGFTEMPLPEGFTPCQS